MRVQILSWLLIALPVTLSLSLPGLAIAAPEIGDPAPDFSLQGSDGNTYSLEKLMGNRGIVIAFFPKAFTGG